MPEEHEHRYADAVRMRGQKERRKCVCGALGPWVKPLKDLTPIPSNNPAVLRVLTLDELRRKAKAEKVRGYSKMKKSDLIDALTEVKVG